MFSCVITVIAFAGIGIVEKRRGIRDNGFLSARGPISTTYRPTKPWGQEWTFRCAVGCLKFQCCKCLQFFLIFPNFSELIRIPSFSGPRVWLLTFFDIFPDISDKFLSGSSPKQYLHHWFKQRVLRILDQAIQSFIFVSVK